MFRSRFSAPQRFFLDGVSWERYRQVARAFGDRHLRLTYDRGSLEMTTLSQQREIWSAFLGRFVIALTEELHMPIHEGRSALLSRKRQQRGLEPDNCYWITHEADVRANERIDLRTDPPPDLAIEVDVARSVLNRMSIFTRLGVPEVWRFNVQGIAFFTLNAERRYVLAEKSGLFPLPIAPLDLMPFVQMRGQQDQNEIIRNFRSWIRERMSPRQS